MDIYDALESPQQAWIVITELDDLYYAHRDFDAAMSRLIDSFNQINNNLMQRVEPLQLGAPRIVPFPARPPLMDIPEYVSTDNPNHTLNEMKLHLVTLMSALRSRYYTLELVPYCYKCLQVLDKNIRRYFQGLAIDTSDFTNLPPIPPSANVSYPPGLEPCSEMNSQDVLKVVRSKKYLGLHILKCAAQRLAFYRDVCASVLSSNLHRGRVLLMARASNSNGAAWFK